MAKAQIVIEGLTKTYQTPVRDPGLGAALASLIKRRYCSVEAVRDVSFTLAEGERVALLGPNGAGKTTLLKMLAGLLRPTAGTASVAGFTPWERHYAYLRNISMVMGNKSQLLWDIPPLDSFTVLARIYDLPQPEFQAALDELVALLDLGPLLNSPVRNLSLGERMKCELVAALLHRPQILFLDEPTIGLDVSAQRRLRAFLDDYNRRHGVSFILTSHYMADVTALCDRVILIHQGSLLYDGSLRTLATRLAPFKLMRVTLNQALEYEFVAPPETELVEQTEDSITLRVARSATSTVAAQLLQQLPVADLVIEDAPIESVMDQIYTGGQL
ncbi:MAG: ATP-binding cassette domain-containing protein [Anaerolineales bacterium]|nr:ATP-binding cassette domain-containing protein [Anaerolineales bacterium]